MTPPRPGGYRGRVDPHRLDRAQARRIAIRAQLLDADRPTDLVDAVRHLTFLQVDPTAAIAPNADLVAWSRLGADYAPADLVRALEEDRALIEFNALIRPMEDLALYRADMERSPEYPRSREGLRSNESFRRDVLARLRDAGPLTSRDISDTSVVSWSSSGWTGNRNVTQMLEFLALRGEVAIVARRKRERVWDLAERAYPGDLAVVPCPPTRHAASATNADCGRSGSRARSPRPCRWSRRTSAPRANPP